MYLEGVVVCVGYADFLAHTLPHNKNHFNRLVIVTDTKDTATHTLCEHLHVECIKTDVFYEDGDKFNKGKGINEGLKALSRADWVVHFDADIYLPPLTRSILEKIDCQPDMIYGIDRMMCPTYEAWMNYLSNPKPTHEGWIYIHPTIFPMGVRIAEYHSKGWEPIGFFQMWHPKTSGVDFYPERHGAADRTDVQHAKKWARSKRALIPEIIGIHLDSENLNLKNMGKNWNGRQTAPFTWQHAVNEKIAGAQSELDKQFDALFDEVNEEAISGGYNVSFLEKIQIKLKGAFEKILHSIFEIR